MDGYTRIPNELMRNPDLPPIAKVVWSLIAGMKPSFDATLSQYCKMVKCHPNTWRSVIKMLELFGMVSIEYRANGVAYTAITDTSKWMIVGNKICDHNKNCEGNKNCNGEGNKNCYEGGNKICDPSEEHITEEHKNNNIVVADAHARTHEEFVANALTDMAVERGCMAMRITREEYRQLLTEVINDWEYRQLPDNDWTLTHLLAQMRIKHNINNRSNGNNRQSGQTLNTRDRLAQDAVKAMAALAEESGRADEPPF